LRTSSGVKKVTKNCILAIPWAPGRTDRYRYHAEFGILSGEFAFAPGQVGGPLPGVCPHNRHPLNNGLGAAHCFGR
jgi:hypothetical protein